MWEAPLLGPEGNPVRTRKLVAAATAAATLGLVAVTGSPALASSHREAPLISQDPVADNTDLYSFRDPSNPAMVDFVANYVGLELPQGGPNFTRFGDDVLYEIHVDNNGDVADDITYQFRFRTVTKNPDTFLYATGSIATANDAKQNVEQFYSVQRIDSSGTHLIASDVPTPPVNIGPRSTPNYPNIVAGVVNDPKASLPGGGKVFAGQREDPFFVDLGSIFDLGALRPIQANHVIPMSNSAGVDGLAGYNVHSIVLQLPITSLLKPGANPACTGVTTVDDKSCVIGSYASASRQRVKVLSLAGGAPRNAGRWVQVSRLGIPLVNEVLIPLGKKDLWNSVDPVDDSQFFGNILDPELTRLLPVLYPGVFNNSNTPQGGAANRPDLIQLLTGRLAGLSAANALPPADLLRLNVSTPVTALGSQNREGAAGGDADGFPNGRRLRDDVVDIEIQVLAGALLNGGISANIPGTGVPYSALADGVNTDDAGAQTAAFPYVPDPYDGYHQQVPGHAAP